MNIADMLERVVTVDNLRILVGRGIFYPQRSILDNNLHIVHHYDYMMRAWVSQVSTYICGGDVTDETKTVEYTHEFQVFQTWWDHLKYSVRERRTLTWLPQRWVKGLQIRYQPVFTKKAVTVPVHVRRMCPHLDGPRLGDTTPHLRFLVPSQFKPIERM